MPETIDLKEVQDYVENHIDEFHEKRISKIRKLTLTTLLKKKNPYLYRSKNIQTPEQLIRSMLDPYLVSQEETIFGDFLENLARFVASKVYGAQKASAEGIDLEMMIDQTRYLIAIKSGPNWGNSDQIQRMISNFKKAKTSIRTNNPKMEHVEFVNGCCYGKDANPEKSEYRKLCGQQFWHFISNREDFYIEIIEPLGFKAKQKNDSITEEISAKVTLFAHDFSEQYCINGKIDWIKLLKFNSKAEKK